MEDRMGGRLLLLYEELNIGIMVVAASGELLYFNRHVCVSMDKCPQDIRGQMYWDVFEPDFSQMYALLAEDCADGRTHTRVFYWENRAIWEQVSAEQTTWEGEQPAILLSITNITDVSRSECTYKQMAYYDRLLNLPNGQKLEEDIASLSAVDRAALIHFDIDRFATVNELYGWDAGDALLMQIRDWLLSSLRNTSRLYRTNDDEFCLFIQDISLEEAKARAEEILQRFAQPWVLEYHENTVEVYFTLTMGIVYGRRISGDTRNILYRTTHAPRQGKIEYALYDEAMDAYLHGRARLRQNLVNCIKDGMRGFEVYFQPIVAAATDQWVGAEALCRWTSPSGEFVSPGVFIPEVEELGLIHEMDEWIRQTALAQCMEWGLHRKYFFLDMNLSPLQAMDDAFVDRFLAMLDRLGYPRDKLTLEITETEKMEFSEENLAGLRRLRDAGINLALDDFGTGYSTLETLVKIPAKVLKTERLFIQSLEHDSYSQYLMNVLIDIAHRVDMALIAEGVETATQRELLKSYGADYLQGYLYARPMPAAQFAKKLSAFTA